MIAWLLFLSADLEGFDRSQALLKERCAQCHGGQAKVGGFSIEPLANATSLRTHSAKWTAAARRIRNGEMPPKGAPPLSVDQREQFAQWTDRALKAQACTAGPQPGPQLIRRLNRDEYSATLRDLLDMHLDIGSTLPADGAGGEGFDNAAETLFLSPLHAEKYMAAARFAMDFAQREYKSRDKILVAKPGAGTTEEQAARAIFAQFLPRAFRRPVSVETINTYLALFQTTRRQEPKFENAIFFALRAALVSPDFLFLNEPPNPTGTVQPLDANSLANRLSYFLWGSMPDEFLTDVAASGRLHDPKVMREVTRRMLRNDRSLEFARRFIEQWLGTRALTGDKAPDAKLFSAYAASEDVRSDVRLQPVLFFREMLVRDRPVLDFIDSTHTVATRHLSKHYGVTFPVDRARDTQPQWVEVPANSDRGGLLGMGAVLSVSSYPYRTSPVLRGAWVLDAILGTPPPAPPPNVPALEENKAGAKPRSMRERLSQHRENAVCASCHSRMDGIGFALENYDAVGRWRDNDEGQPIDNSGELADGTKFKGPREMKAMLMARKDLFVENLTRRLLGYALGRGLTLEDSCTVDAIVAEVKAKDYRVQALIEAIVLSPPFQLTAPAKTSAR